MFASIYSYEKITDLIRELFVLKCRHDKNKKFKITIFTRKNRRIVTK